MSSSILSYSQSSIETFEKLRYELNLLEKQIEQLKATRFEKENKIEDLKSLIVRVSQETNLLRPIHSGNLACPGLNLNKLISVVSKSTRKYSEETQISEFSKCYSNSANSVTFHDYNQHSEDESNSKFIDKYTHHNPESIEQLNDDNQHFAAIFEFWSQNLCAGNLISIISK